MTERIQSQAGPYLTGPETTEQLREGAESSYTWTGTREECYNQRAIERAGGAKSTSISPNGDGQWRLVVTHAGSPDDEGGPEADLPTNQHELETSQQEINFWESRVCAALFSYTALMIVYRVHYMYKEGIYADGQDYIRQTAAIETAWKDMTPQTRAKTDLSRLLTRGGVSSEDALCQKLIDRLMSGFATRIIEFESVYRRSITAAVYSQVQAAYTGVGKIWTTSEVESFEGTPTGEWFGLPSTQWLKLPPRVSASAGGKTNIEYVYQGGFHSPSRFFYQAYGGATLIDT